MDEKVVGNRITKDDFVYKANTLDEFGNYRYGRNYKVAFLLIPEVKDDAIVMSKSAADNTKFDLITKTELVINKNDILLNIYGDLKNYKRFKEILNDFRMFYGLQTYSFKDIDKFLWQFGKEYFPKKY